MQDCKTFKLYEALEMLEKDRTLVFKGYEEKDDEYTILKIDNIGDSVDREYPQFIHYDNSGEKYPSEKCFDFNNMVCFDMVWELMPKKEVFSYNIIVAKNSMNVMSSSNYNVYIEKDSEWRIVDRNLTGIKIENNNLKLNVTRNTVKMNFVGAE